MNGNNIYISTDGTNVIAGTRSNEITTGCETFEVASATQQQWKEFLAGRKEWQMTVSFLVSSVKPSDPRNPLNIGQTYTLYFMRRGTSDYVRGTAICTQCKITSTRGSIANGSITFQGSGPLQ